MIHSARSDRIGLHKYKQVVENFPYFAVIVFSKLLIEVNGSCIRNFVCRIIDVISANTVNIFLDSGTLLFVITGQFYIQINPL
jgi:hypothetical protein